MNLEAVSSRYPLPKSAYKPYLNLRINPPLDPAELNAQFLYGSSRLNLRTPVTGQASLVLFYKGQEGVVSSFGTTETDLKLLQLQGGDSRKSYRVVTGFFCEDFIADEAAALVAHPDSGLTRLVVPVVSTIEGIIHSESERALTRYKSFILRAMLSWSEEEQAFIRDFAPGSSGTIFSRTE